MNLTQSQKMTFLKQIKDENFLRKEILVPIFRNMGKFTVIDTHGTDEKGKDIVLISENDFKKKQYTAIVLKKDDITNAATGRKNEIVANVITQIYMTLTSGYDCLIQKKKVFFNNIIVVTSGKISNSAREAFVDAAVDRSFNSIDFIDSDELIKYIDEYLPEIYFVSSGSLSQYFHELKNRCEALVELNSISEFNHKDKKVSDIFIEPKLFRKKEYVENDSTKVKFAETVINKLIEKTGFYLIKGNAGSGKSTLLRSKVIKLIGDYELENSKKIPFFIKLKMLVRDYSTSPEEHFISFVEKEYSLNFNTLFSKSSDNEPILFLDGFDELVTENEISAFYEIIEYIKTITKTIIISSRNQKFQENENIKGFKTWKLADFSFKQISTFISKWFNKQNNELINNLQDHNLLDKMPNTPLVITLVSILFDADRNVEVPSNLSELYSMFIDLLLGKWNADRRLDTFYKSNDKETFLEELAMDMHFNNHISYTKDDVLVSFDKTQKKLGRTFDNEKMLEEIVNETNLLCINEYSEYEFRHLSFQEYFVGKKLTVKNDISAIIDKLPSSWWDQVIYYYCGIRKENDDVLPEIYNNIGSLEPRKKLLQIFNMGYLIQSSYKTDANIRKDLICKCITDYSISADQFIDSIPNEYKAPLLIRNIMLIDAFAMHFKSKYLNEVLKQIYEENDVKDPEDRSEVLSRLILTLLLAYNGELNYLADNDKYFKKHPDLLLIEDFFLRCELLEEEKEKSKRNKLKQISVGIKRKLRKNVELYKNIINEK